VGSGKSAYLQNLLRGDALHIIAPGLLAQLRETMPEKSGEDAILEDLEGERPKDWELAKVAGSLLKEVATLGAAKWPSSIPPLMGVLFETSLHYFYPFKKGPFLLSLPPNHSICLANLVAWRVSWAVYCLFLLVAPGKLASATAGRLMSVTKVNPGSSHNSDVDSAIIGCAAVRALLSTQMGSGSGSGSGSWSGSGSGSGESTTSMTQGAFLRALFRVSHTLVFSFTALSRSPSYNPISLTPHIPPYTTDTTHVLTEVGEGVLRQYPLPSLTRAKRGEKPKGPHGQ